MFEQLIQAKLLDKGVKAVVLGEFTESEEKNGKDLASVALKRFAQSVPYPVLTGLRSGHGEMNYPIPLNTPCELILGKKAELRCGPGGLSSIF
jgi:muramoyltetrapeptide carboxypeptidase